MIRKRKQVLKNQLATIREQRGLGQKQVATLLGHGSPQQLSRYENGTRVPNLRTALKLAQIYNIPIGKMLDEYYEACIREIRKEEKKAGGATIGHPSESIDSLGGERCAFADLLLGEPVDDAAIRIVRTHATDLIRKTAEKLGHI